MTTTITALKSLTLHYLFVEHTTFICYQKPEPSVNLLREGVKKLDLSYDPSPFSHLKEKRKKKEGYFFLVYMYFL